MNEKLSLPEKENTWILFSGAKLVWIIGQRLDDRFKVTEDTKEILQIEYKKKDPNPDKSEIPINQYR